MSGSIVEKTRRDQIRLMSRLHRLEEQLGIRSTIRFKHWAMALTLGLISLSAKAQTVPFRPEKLMSAASLSGVLATGDFNGDGHPDLLNVAETGDHQMMFGDGKGSFSDPVVIGSQKYEVQNVLVADMDNDGDEDLLILESYGKVNRWQLWSNDGTGTAFSESTAEYSTNVYFYGASSQIVDIDADGDMDLLTSYAYKGILMRTVGGADYGTWVAYLNDGKGDLSNEFALDESMPVLNYAYGVIAGDFDNDGDMDLAVFGYSSSRGDNVLAAYLNSGYLSWESNTTSTSFRRYGALLEVSDMDNDGDLDIAVKYEVEGYRVGIYTNDGGGIFYRSANAYFSSYGLSYLDRMAVIDADGDADKDLLVRLSNDTGNDVWSWISYNGDQWVEMQTFSGDFNDFENVYVDDWDGDGDEDFLAVSMDNITLFANQAGTFTPVSSPVWEDFAASRFVVEDLNGDGFPDVVGNDLGQILLNDGTGGFSRSQTIARESAYRSEWVSVADIDNDGDLDVVFAGGGLDYDYILHQQQSVLVAINKDGIFTPSIFDIGSGTTYGLTLQDEHDDQLPEIMVLYEGETSGLLVLNNSGTGEYPVSNVFGGQFNASGYLGIESYGDLDGDGHSDLLLPSPIQMNFFMYGSDYWSLNSGPFLASDINVASAYDLTDLDNDGDLDVVFANNLNYSLNNPIAIRDDSGSYFSTGTSIARSSNSYDVQGADFDMDGDNDVLFADPVYGNSLFLNSGDAKIFTVDEDSDAPKSKYLGAGDVDGDGDSDVMALDIDGALYVLFNDLIPSLALEDANFTMAENPTNGTIVGSLGDNVESFTYSIVSGNDAGAFAISGSDLIVADSSFIDYETTALFSLVVSVNNGATLQESTVTINVTDVNEAPVVSDFVIDLPENVAGGTVIDTLTAIDPEGAALLYQIISGNDSTTFSLDISSAELTVNDPTYLDYETHPLFVLEVNAIDGVEFQSGFTVTIRIQDVNEAPDMTEQTFEIAENSSAGTVIGSVTATDPEGGAVTFSIDSGNALEAVALDSLTGVLTVADSSFFDYESVTELVLQIKASDGIMDSVNTVTVYLTNENEAPELADTLFLVDESLSNGTVVGVLNATDPESDALTFMLIEGNTDDAFALDAATGELSINNTDAIDYDVIPDYYLTVVVSDGTLEVSAVMTIEITSLERDRQALLALYDATGGNSWTNSAGWSESAELTEDWNGVTIANGRVTRLSLPDNNLKGGIPDSFIELTGLEYIDFSENDLTEIPALPQTKGLDTLNLSENQFDITQLLRNVDVALYTYAPQQVYGTTAADTLYAASDYTLSVTGLSANTGDTYQWYLNSDVITNGTALSYELVSLDFEKMGTYHLELGNDQLPDLTLVTADHTVHVATDISGKVNITESEALTSGEVELFRITDTGPFVMTDSIALATDGTYLIEKVVLGNFILLVQNNLEEFPDVMQTYYVSEYDWLDADTLKLFAKAEAIDITMVSKPSYTSVDGGAFFEGTVETDFTEEIARTTAREAVKRSGCSIRRSVSSGKGEEEVYELYAYVETDDEGYFSFEGVAPGTYQLNIQYPGVPMDPDSNILFVVPEDVSSVHFQIEALVKEDYIEVSSERVLGLTDEAGKRMLVYPNPTEGEVEIAYEVAESLEYIQLSVFDLSGSLLFTQELDGSPGTHKTSFDLSGYHSGLYLLIFRDPSGAVVNVLKVGKK